MRDAPTAAGFAAELEVFADSAVRYDSNRRAAASGGDSGQLIAEAFERAAGIADQAEERAKARQATACSKGCAWCCHQNVRVSAAEVFHLARRLRAQLSGEELAALTAHARATASRLSGMPQPQRARERVPCALLESSTGACSAHGVRPMLCRGQLSASAQTCRQAVESPGEHHFEPLLDAIHGAGLASLALEVEFGFLGGPVAGELTAMLAVALNDPEAEARWWRGENPFPAHREFAVHMNSRLARMVVAAWQELATDGRGPGRQAQDLRGAAMGFLRRTTGLDAPLQ